ncbi:hypothetical protein [Leptolyngbya sp. 7M]|nr:hypothetical protein [Leptolyngbya sp. 7M]
MEVLQVRLIVAVGQIAVGYLGLFNLFVDSVLIAMRAELLQL